MSKNNIDWNDKMIYVGELQSLKENSGFDKSQTHAC